MDHLNGLQNLKENTAILNGAISSEMNAFWGFAGEVFKDKALSVKQKELITLGIAIAVRCEGCIEAHVNNLVGLGATKEEIAETVAVAVVMGGGPSTVYGGKALEAFDQITAK